jgi:hypothetical protein
MLTFIYFSRLLTNERFDQRLILKDGRHSLMGDRGKGIEIVYNSKEKNILYWND